VIMAIASSSPAERHVQSVRAFNRFYTQQIGVLRNGLLDSPFSLTEVRVLYELAHRHQPTASEIRKELGLDAGYLSRILRGFEKRRLIKRETSSTDTRQALLSLTTDGQKTFAPLNARSNEEVASMLSKLPEQDQKRLVTAMRTIESLLGVRAEPKTPYILRPHHPGDMGWVVHRHGVLYNQEYGYDEGFEALVAQIVSHFVKKLDPKRERCWIAERDSEMVGSIFLVKQSKTIAKLRLLLVEPSARGLGIGARLVDECIRFARQVGYRKMVLWTQSELHAARRIYEKAGFRLVKEEPHKSWGRTDLVAQIWELNL
jgi:DNA-binding MarR family transcriptional regulator/GNAT superfamily N-acetyltransferase